MSFVLVLILIAVMAVAGFLLVRHDIRARRGSESYRRTAP
jgi:hypothetical protein